MTYSPQEYSELVRKQLNDLLTDNRPFLLAVGSTLSSMSERIFTNGLNSNDSKIGNYQDGNKPLYVNTEKELRKTLPPKGKTGKTKFDNGKPHKTTYFENYKDFKGQLTGNNSFVDLNLSGDLKSDFENGLVQVSPTEINITLREENIVKMEGNEARFKCDISKNTEKEIQELVDTLQYEIIRKLNGDA